MCLLHYLLLVHNLGLRYLLHMSHLLHNNTGVPCDSTVHAICSKNCSAMGWCCPTSTNRSCGRWNLCTCCTTNTAPRPTPASKTQGRTTNTAPQLAPPTPQAHKTLMPLNTKAPSLQALDHPQPLSPKANDTCAVVCKRLQTTAPLSPEACKRLPKGGMKQQKHIKH